MNEVDAYPTESGLGRHLVICTRCGGSMISFEEGALLHKLLGQSLERFLDPSPIVPEPDPPRCARPSAASAAAQPLESLA